MHPLENIRGAASHHLLGRHIVLAVSGSIAAVKTVEIARELVRHGAQVTAVMSKAATQILHPDALHFATGRPPIVALSGAVEHVALLGDVPNKADALLVAPATANTISKMALGIDDSVVTTCATVAIGTKTPILVAPAMHEAMLDHETVTKHLATLEKQGMYVVWPRREEHKAKLADPEAIADATMAMLADGPWLNQTSLVVGGATQEPIDDIRVLGNRSSGQSAIALALELYRRGAKVELWLGHHTYPLPTCLQPFTKRFSTHADLLALAPQAKGQDTIWMPAAIADYSPVPYDGKISSGNERATIEMQRVDKIAPHLIRASRKARLILFKAEGHAASAKDLEAAARKRMEQYTAFAAIANTAATFGSPKTRALLVLKDSSEWHEGDKLTVMRTMVDAVAP